MAAQETASQKEEAPPPPLGSAAASTDPRVHQLLAERAIAVLNGDKGAVKDADEALASLGVSAG